MAFGSGGAQRTGRQGSAQRHPPRRAGAGMPSAHLTSPAAVAGGGGRILRGEAQRPRLPGWHGTRLLRRRLHLVLNELVGWREAAPEME